MKRTREDTRLEIWGANYINEVHGRLDEDENVQIIQIEPGNGNDYIVEVLDV